MMTVTNHKKILVQNATTNMLDEVVHDNIEYNTANENAQLICLSLQGDSGDMMSTQYFSMEDLKNDLKRRKVLFDKLKRELNKQ